MTDEREELAKLLFTLRFAVADYPRAEWAKAASSTQEEMIMWADRLLPYIRERVDAAKRIEHERMAPFVDAVVKAEQSKAWDNGYTHGVDAERERCAEIAGSHNGRGNHIHYPGTCGVAIAAAICDGEGK